MGAVDFVDQCAAVASSPTMLAPLTLDPPLAALHHTVRAATLTLFTLLSLALITLAFAFHTVAPQPPRIKSRRALTRRWRRERLEAACKDVKGRILRLQNQMNDL